MNTLTLTTIIIGLLLAFLFSITNATSYKRGYISGLEDGMKAQLEQVNGKEYRVKLNK